MRYLYILMLVILLVSCLWGQTATPEAPDSSMAAGERAENLLSISNLFEDNLKRADEYAWWAWQESRKANGTTVRIKALDRLTNLHLRQGNWDLAWEYGSQLQNLAWNTTNDTLLTACMETLERLQQSTTGLEQARAAYKHYYLVQDSTSTGLKQRQADEMAKLKRARDRQEVVSLVIFVGFLFISLIALLHYSLHRSVRREMQERRAGEERVNELNRTLERRVEEEVEKLRRQQALLIQKSKLESLGQLSAGIAHEINQPLTRMAIGTDNILNKLESGCQPDYIRTKCQAFLQNIDRINQIIEHIRLFSREQSQIGSEYLDPAELIDSVIGLVQAQFASHNIGFECQISNPSCRITGNRYKLEQVLINLLTNSRDAILEKYCGDPADKERIAIRVFDESNSIVLEVEDRGCGIDEKSKGQIFDPFFTTKEPDRGTGLGLSVSYGIIEEMGGSIQVDSKAGEYTIMRLVIPVTGAETCS